MATETANQLDQLCINTIRFLSIDQVEAAKSGHPGTPMGAAPMAYVLWDHFLRHNPNDPTWTNRDRFVLSPGHASALLYSLLHLTGYDLPLEELKRFRQWGSKTPGHPEYDLASGVEMTTGPLGQGFATGVGMAIAERWLASHYNRPGYDLFDHYTYGIVSDGDLQEGVASEAASLAGTLELGRLIYLYDDNDISIEGDTDISFRENVGDRFRAYGWHVVGPVDGTDLSAVKEAIRAAQAETSRPSLVVCQTQIGFGSPNKAGTASAHGEPLGSDEVRITRENLGWTYEEPFSIPDDALVHLRQAGERGDSWQKEWETLWDAYAREYPAEATEVKDALAGNIPESAFDKLDGLFDPAGKPVSTRDASGAVMNAIAEKVHFLIGGSADLAPSTKTLLNDRGDYSADDYGGRNLHFGVREHAMGAIANGVALHGGVIPYTATFLIFYDYMRPAVRLGALMGLQAIYIFTHDSIGLGEDGPTHQPIEHLAAMRAVPGLTLIRPADATETAGAWKAALLRKDGPTALIFSRQGLPVLDHEQSVADNGVLHGGYVLWESKPDEQPNVILIGTGSEVHIALEAGRLLEEQNVTSRVVSLPSWERFQSQPVEYRDAVLPPTVRARVSIEAASPFGWERYVGTEGLAIGLDRFGASAPAGALYKELGFTAEHMAEEAARLYRERANP